jgi:hypothetical protein
MIVNGSSCRSNRIVTFLPLHLMAQTNPLSEILCLNKFKMMEYVQDNSHVYCNITSSETVALSIVTFSFKINQLHCLKTFSLEHVKVHINICNSLKASVTSANGVVLFKFVTYNKRKMAGSEWLIYFITLNLHQNSTSE